LLVFEAREHDLYPAAAPVAALVVLDRLVAGSPARNAEQTLMHYVRRLLGAAWGRYGSPRMHAALGAEGW